MRVPEKWRKYLPISDEASKRPLKWIDAFRGPARTSTPPPEESSVIIDVTEELSGMMIGFCGTRPGGGKNLFRPPEESTDESK